MMDYKELIERLNTYSAEHQCHGGITAEAADAMKTLLAERDAAIEMLHGECHACKHNAGWHNVGKCCTCIHETAGPLIPKEQCDDNWEWRGKKPEDG